MDWKLMGRRFKILLWKNMVIRRRNLKVNCLAVLFIPLYTFMSYTACIYAPVKHYSVSSPSSSLPQANPANQAIHETSKISMNLLNFLDSRLPNITSSGLSAPLPSPTTKEITTNACDWIIPFQRQQIGQNYSIGFTPNSMNTRRIVEEVVDTIESYNCSHGNNFPSPVLLSGSLKADGFDSIQHMKMAQLQREVNIRKTLNRNGKDEGRKLFVGIAFYGICKTSTTISYKIWYQKERNVDEKIEREDLLLGYGSKWKTQKHLFTQTSFSKEEELKRAGFQMILDKVLVRFFLSQHVQNLNQTFDLTQVAGKSVDISLEPLARSSRHANPFKSPKTERKRASKVVGFILPLYIVIFLPVVSGVVNEKKSQLKSLLTLMGIPRWMCTLCWFVDGMVIGCICSGLVTLVFKTRFGDFGMKNTEAPYHHSDWTPLFFIILVYVVHGFSLSFFVSSLFNTAHVAMSAMVTVMIAFSHAFTMNLANLSTFKRSVAVMFLPNCGTGLLVTLAFDLELKGIGLHWSNFCDPMEMVGSMNFLQFVSLQLGMSLVYMLLAQYMENILLQDSYGVAKPFYYPLLLSTWFSFAKKNIMTSSDRNWGQKLGARCNDSDNKRREKRDEFELDPADIKPGVEILGLTKEFNRGQNGKKKRAVNNFHLNLLEGQITVLLGHNGSGKTTLISMLTGLSKPMDGTAVVHGHNLNLEMAEIHKDLGFCPQKNVLCNDLSVVENLLFFGQLKGLNKHEIHPEVQGLLDALGLKEKENTPAKFLSGGQKRKLQLAISLISDSKVVYLDEPTSGMDPESRRLVWSFLLEMRKKRTILLTTHFMEEAEVCGDRIAIMEAGQLKYCGTSFFLKRLFGTGYTLHLNLNSTPEGDKRQMLVIQEAILSKVRHYAKDARIKPRFFQNNMELDIILPMVASVSKNDSGNDSESEYVTVSSQIPLLLQDLNGTQDELKIKKNALFVTTMDDIFSSAIGEDHLFANETRKFDESISGTSNGENYLKHDNGYTRSETLSPSLALVSPLKLTIRQMYALLKRRIEYNWNHKELVVVQFIVSCPFVVLAVDLMQSKQDELWVHEEEKYEDVREWEDMKNFSAVDVNLNLNGTGLTIRGLYSPFFKGSAQFASNLVANSILQRVASMSSIGKVLSMTVMPSGVFHNLEDYDMLKHMEITNLDKPIRFSDVSSIFGLAVMVFYSTFLTLPLQEKQTLLKHLEMMTGLSPIIYWSCLFIWDFFLSSILGSVIITIMILMEGDISVTKHGGFVALVLTMCVLNFSGIAFAYVVTCFFTSPASGLFVFAGLIIATEMSAAPAGFMEAFGSSTFLLSNIAEYSLKIPGIATLLNCLDDFYTTAIINSRCNFVPKFIKNVTCDLIHQQQSNHEHHVERNNIFHYCCENVQMKPRPFLEWDVENSSGVTNVKSYDNFGGFQGLGQELVIFFTIGLSHWILLFAIEYQIYEQVYNLWLRFNSQGHQHQNQNQTQEIHCTAKSMRPLDQDVQTEQERINTQTKHGQKDALMCVDLCKKFGSFQAVSNLNFGVHPGECFGLLGVNGAGKSTTFRILTGGQKPSFGNAFINDTRKKTRRILNLVQNKQGYLKNIGYCPQVDALLPMLTGRQHLELFARLRGCSSKETKIQVQRWLHNLGLEECADYQCGNYSGGMQRRLNTAISMIANPSLILLDEPTSGVDPISRRQFWRVVASLKNTGQSVILTSHCMEECENLCSRLAIMVGGQLQCLGSPNSLREKSPQGYVLKIQLRSQVQSKEAESTPVHLHRDQLEALISEIVSKFHPCTLQEFHQNRIQFSLADKEMSLAEIFTMMEEISIQYSNQIQEYCLGETTLEQIFLAVATSGGFQSLVNRSADAVTTHSHTCL